LSDTLIRHDGEQKEAAVSLRVLGGAGNLFADNLLGNRVEIPKEAGEVR
jgi:hypothetical protein